jgi:hypothetical protein
MPAKKIVVALLIIVVAIGGFVAGLVLLRQRQDIEDEAAVEGGQATVSISPQTGSYEVGDSIAVSVHFNPSNIAISSVGVRLTYPFKGATPEVTVSSVDINPSILSSADWTCPTPDDPRLAGTEVVVDIACANIGSGGFTANTDTLLATVNLYVERPLSENINPLTVRFDAKESKITRWRDNQDILLIPQSTGSYTVSSTGVDPTNTPTPTGIEDTDDLTNTPTLTPTGVATATPTTAVTTTGSPTPTTAETLPDAGVSYPTLMGIGVGAFILLAALILAL